MLLPFSSAFRTAGIRLKTRHDLSFEYQYVSDIDGLSGFELAC